MVTLCSATVTTMPLVLQTKHRKQKKGSKTELIRDAGQNNLRCVEMPSSASAGAGPIASTVREPAAICVRPASILEKKRKKVTSVSSDDSDSVGTQAVQFKGW